MRNSEGNLVTVVNQCQDKCYIDVGYKMYDWGKCKKPEEPSKSKSVFFACNLAYTNNVWSLNSVKVWESRHSHNSIFAFIYFCSAVSICLDDCSTKKDKPLCVKDHVGKLFTVNNICQYDCYKTILQYNLEYEGECKDSGTGESL